MVDVHCVCRCTRFLASFKKVGPTSELLGLMKKSTLKNDVFFVCQLEKQKVSADQNTQGKNPDHQQKGTVT